MDTLGHGTRLAAPVGGFRRPGRRRIGGFRGVRLRGHRVIGLSESLEFRVLDLRLWMQDAGYSGLHSDSLGGS